MDFFGSRALVGNDPTHQIVGDLDPRDPDFEDWREEATPEALAERGAAWFRSQARRPIERREWNDAGHVALSWLLVDTQKPLVFRYRPPARPADRVIPVVAVAGPDDPD